MADIQKLNVNNTTYDISTTWSKVTGKPSTFPPESHTHSYLPLSGGTMSNQNVVVNLNADLLDGYSGSAYAKKTDLASYLPLSGGTVTGIIKRNSGGSWISGRDNVIVMQTKTNPAGNSWNPVIGVKTQTGCWTMGSVGGEGLQLSYDTDTDYTSNNNTSSVIYFPSAGSSGTLALTSQIPSTMAWSAITGKPSTFAPSSHTHTKSQITDFPTIPTNTNQLTNGAGFITGITKSMVTTALGYTPPTSDTNTTYSAGTGLSLSSTTFSVKYGSSAGTACQGNDSRLSNSRPASDVYAWAKSASKPTYTYSEVGAAASGHTHNTIVGSYTTNGGQQNPNYFGTNKVGALMMNTTVNGNSHYKDWLFMDCYAGSDDEGGVAIGVNRQALGLYIMRSAAARTSWSESAEIIGTHNYTTYCATSGHNHNSTYVAIAGAQTITGSKTFSNKIVASAGVTIGSTDDIGWYFYSDRITAGTQVARGVNVGSLLVSNAWADASNVPTNGIYCKGNIKAAAFYQNSDERLKTFHDPIKVDLEKLKTLRKNYFKFNDRDKLEIGVSAQEIQEIYPEIVSTDSDGYLSIAYDKLSVIALSAIDELDNKYRKENNDLREHIEVLEGQLEAIKNILNEKGIL